MTATELEDMGPIDYLVVEFPGSRMTGEGLPLLVDLVDRGIIRILDLVFVKKELDGSVKGLAIADLDKDGQLVASGRIPVQAVLAALDASESSVAQTPAHSGGKE
jgi:hypothetical protein